MKTTATSTWLVVVATAAIVFAVFSPAIFNDFVRWADDFNVLDNAAFRGFSADPMRWMFTTFYWGDYRPLCWLSFGIDFALWGMNPLGYHLTNVLLHVLNTVVFFLLLKRLLAGSRHAGEEPVWFSICCAVGALVFAIHPLRVESVAWVSRRDDLLSVLFALLTALFYLTFRDRRHRPAWLCLALVCYALSLLSRAWSMTLPVVLVIVDLYRSGDAKRPMRHAIPFFVLAAAAAGVSFVARREGMGMASLAEHGIPARFAQAAYGLCFYLWKTIVPMNLSPLYLLNHTVRAADPTYLLCGLFVIGLSMAFFLLRRRWPWAWASWLCYAVMLAPVLGFTQSGWQLVADRYTYMALLPLGVLAAGGLIRVPVHSIRGMAAAILVAWSALTVRQIDVWRDTVSLWKQALRVDRGNYVALNLLGREKERAGDPAGAMRDYDEALRLDPRYIDAYLNRGQLRYRLNELAGAEDDFSQVIRLNYTTDDAFLVRGMIRQKRGDAAGAMDDYDMALLLDPDSANVLRNRAILFYSERRLAEAIMDYGALLKHQPESADAWVDRGRLKKEAGDLPGALDDFSAAIRLAPTSAATFVDRAVVRGAQGDRAGAMADCEEAVRLNPNEPLAYFNRGVLFDEQGKRDEARADFQSALRLAPADWPFRAQVQAALDALGAAP